MQFMSLILDYKVEMFKFSTNLDQLSCQSNATRLMYYMVSTL